MRVSTTHARRSSSWATVGFVLVTAACASRQGSTTNGQFDFDSSYAYVLSAPIETQHVQAELRRAENGDLLGAGFGLESCGGAAVSASTQLSGQTLTMHYIPPGTVHRSRSTLRIECDAVRIMLNREHDATIRGVVSVRVAESVRRSSGQVDVGDRWTPNTRLVVQLRRR